MGKPSSGSKQHRSRFRHPEKRIVKQLIVGNQLKRTGKKLDQTYYDTVKQLEQDGVDPEYIQGWVAGYLGNPEREEQRVTDAYRAGYADAKLGNTEQATSWDVA